MNKLACAATLAMGLAFFGPGTEEAKAGHNSFVLSIGGPRGGGFTYAIGPSFRYGRGPAYGWGGGGGFYGRPLPPVYGRPIYRPPVRSYYRPGCDRGGRYFYGF